MCRINDINFMNFPPVMLDDLDIDTQWMLSAKDRFLLEHINLMPFVYLRYTKGKLTEYHVPTTL